MSMFEKAIAHVEAGLAQRAYSCAALAIGRGEEVYVRRIFGNSQAEPEIIPMTENTLFDLASLTKLVSTTMVALRLLEEGKLALYDSLGMFFPDAGKYASVTIRELMTHTSGLPHLPLYLRCTSPEEALPTIFASEPVHGRDEEVLYSCMNFILLAKILELVGGKPLDVLAREYVFDPLGMKTACYNPTTADVATTEFSRWHNHWVRGHVHDENAFFLGGVAGNAGVFASLDDMIAFSAMLSRRGRVGDEIYLSRRTFDFATHNFTPDLYESRGLGFQLQGKQYSPMGDLMSYGSYGHTGYTGTSLYVDADTGLYIVLLTNAVHFGRENRGGFFRLRRSLHNVVIAEYSRMADANRDS